MSDTSPGSQAAAIDPITAEIITHSLNAITQLIDKNITRTAYSVLVSEYKDFQSGLSAPMAV